MQTEIISADVDAINGNDGESSVQSGILSV
jgi:hypothetical protein